MIQGKKSRMDIGLIKQPGMTRKKPVPHLDAAVEIRFK